MIDGFDSVIGGFVHESAPMRVVFGAGRLADVPAEVDRLGAKRVLLVAGGPEEEPVEESMEAEPPQPSYT